MSVNRIEELQKISDDFLSNLYQSENKRKRNLQTIDAKIRKSFSTVLKTNCQTQKSTNLNFKYSPKQFFKTRKLDNNIYKTLSPWTPPKHEGGFLGSFLRLQDKHDMDNWEKVI